MTDLPSPSRREKFGERLFNYLITNVPSHTVRLGWLRFFGATIGVDSSIMMGTTIFGLSRLQIGDCCTIGSNALLDARGGLVIDDDAVLSSDVHVISVQRVADSDDLHVHAGPVHIGHHAWVTSRATVLHDVKIGAGAVVGAGSLADSDVEDMGIVAGIPAKPRGKRKSSLAYRGKSRPKLY